MLIVNKQSLQWLGKEVDNKKPIYFKDENYTISNHNLLNLLWLKFIQKMYYITHRSEKGILNTNF